MQSCIQTGMAILFSVSLSQARQRLAPDQRREHRPLLVAHRQREDRPQDDQPRPPRVQIFEQRTEQKRNRGFGRESSSVRPLIILPWHNDEALSRPKRTGSPSDPA